MQSFPPAKGCLGCLLCVASSPAAGKPLKLLSPAPEIAGFGAERLHQADKLCWMVVQQPSGLECNETTINHNSRLVPKVKQLAAEMEKPLSFTHV